MYASVCDASWICKQWKYSKKLVGENINKMQDNVMSIYTY